MTVIDGFSIDHIFNLVIILGLHINQKKNPQDFSRNQYKCEY